MRVQLSGETDFADFRAHARALLERGAAPADVHWTTQSGDEDLFGSAAPGEPALVAGGAAPKVSASFLELCETVVLHRDSQRFTLLYRLLWRMQREPLLRDDPLDPDMMQARQMAKAVRHDIHKMRAFVRFREVAEEGGGVVHVAWFEPAHHIVEANAPWFMRRFANMRWALLTPDRCASWDGEHLVLRPGADRSEAPQPDAGEALWLTYYESIFNPARLKLATMRREMPRRYWHNLPEATLISPLASRAMERSGGMLAQPATQPLRTIRSVVRLQEMPPAGTLQELQAGMQQCRNCGIGEFATQAVPGQGPLRPALMLVGEQPGDQEDLAGRPFVGPAGQLLDRALQEANIDRGQLFLTNAVRHFKFELRGKRRIHKTPTQAEAATCAHWLEREIALVQPRALVALGATAARSLLGRHVAITQERGRWHQRADGLRVLVTWHPSALLRMTDDERTPAFARFAADLALASSA